MPRPDPASAESRLDDTQRPDYPRVVRAVAGTIGSMGTCLLLTEPR